MRILLVNKYYYLRSGTERYLFNLKRLLESKGHTVDVFCMRHPQNQCATFEHHFVPNIDFHDVNTLQRLFASLRVLWYPKAARQIAHVLDTFRPDVVHLFNIYHHLSPSILQPITQRSIPTVLTLNDYKLICPNYLLYTKNEPCTRCRNGFYVHTVLHKCLHGSLAWSAVAALEMTLHKALQIFERHITTFIAPSVFVKTTAQFFGIPSSKLVHVPYFLFTEDFAVSKADDGYFAYVGRLSHEKGLPALIRAMRQVPQAQLLVVGKGPMRPVLEQMTTMWGMTNVRFTGHVTPSKLENIFTGARFTVLPSEWLEVFGQSIIESFAAGIPVVGARIGGIPEVINDGANADGLLFSPGVEDELAACLRRLWDYPQQAKEMGLNGRSKVLEEYNAEIHYAQLMPIYEGEVNS